MRVEGLPSCGSPRITVSNGVEERSSLRVGTAFVQLVKLKYLLPQFDDLGRPFRSSGIYGSNQFYPSVLLAVVD